MRRETFLAAAGLATLFLLAACEGIDQGPLSPAAGLPAYRITSTIPHDGQFDVPLSTQVILHFPASPVADSVADRLHFQVLTGDEPTADVPFTWEVRGESILLFPDALLAERTRYLVTVDAGIVAEDGRMTAEKRTFVFETGVRLPKSAERLAVVRVIPGPDDPCWDFQTFRVYFNEPIDRTSLRYGEAVRMEDAETGDLVPGNLMGRGNQIVFDPDQDLVPGRTYRLTVTDALADDNGEGPIEEFTADFVPRSTGVRADVAIEQCPTALPDTAFCASLDPAELPPHRLSGLPANTLMADSVLLGRTEIPTGTRMWAEFGEAALTPDRVPFILRKGQLIVGAELVGKLGGEIPTGLLSGPIQITLLADAIGELAGSEYIHGVPGLPSAVRITMDVALSTEDPTTAAILGQPLFGITVIGEAEVAPTYQYPDYEALQIEVAGFAEALLINETLAATFSMKMVPPPTLPARFSDDVPPEVLSVSPLPDAGRRSAADEVVLVFSEPVDPDSARDNIRLVGPLGRVEGRLDVYNPKVAFTPDRSLDPGSEYAIEVDPGLADLAGNQLGRAERFTFRTTTRQSSAVDPPLLAASFPAARPDASMPAHFTANLYFTQIMDPGSFVYGETFGVYDDSAGGALVPATPFHYGLFVHIVPDHDWLPDTAYRLVVTPQVTNLDGLPLDTDRDRNPGGPAAIEIPFVVTPANRDVQSMLYTYEYADTDVNGYVDGDETPTETNNIVIEFPLIPEPTYEMGYMPLSVRPLVRDEDGTPRVPIDIEAPADLFATSTGLGLPTAGAADPPGAFQTGRITITQLPVSTADLVPHPDGLTGVDVQSPIYFAVENPDLSDWFQHDLYLGILSKLRFTEEGRLQVIVRGESPMKLMIPVIGEIDVTTRVSMDVFSIPSRRAY